MHFRIAKDLSLPLCNSFFFFQIVVIVAETIKNGICVCIYIHKHAHETSEYRFSLGENCEAWGQVRKEIDFSM